VSVRTLVSLAVAVLLAASGQAISASDLSIGEKNGMCHSIREDPDFRKQAIAVCDKYKYTLPRPRVYNACRTGLSAGEATGCLSTLNAVGSQTCQNMLQMREMTTDLQSVCAKSWRTAPRPTVGTACQEGFKEAAKIMCKSVEYRLQSYENDVGQQEEDDLAKEETTNTQQASATVEETVETAASEPEVKEPVVIAASEQEVAKTVTPASAKAAEEPAKVEELSPKEEEAQAAEIATNDDSGEGDADVDEVEAAIERITEMLDADEQ